MTSTLVILLGIVKIAALVLGSIVALLAYRAYRRTRIEGLQYFAVGLMVLTIGTFLIGVLHHVLGVPTVPGMLLESLLLCAGFVVMIYGRYGYKPSLIHLFRSPVSDFALARSVKASLRTFRTRLSVQL